MDVQPMPGAQFAISGEVQGRFPPGSVTVAVTLSSGLGRQTLQLACCPARFRFSRLAPENYELSAEVTGEPDAAWLYAFHDREKRDLVLELSQPPEIWFRVTPQDAPPFSILARRTDLAGPGDTREIPSRGARLAPGYWDVQVRPAPGWYVNRFGAGQGLRPRVGEDPNWFQMMVSGRGQSGTPLDLAQGTAAVEGAVTRADGKPVPWAPVYLYPESADVRRRLPGIRTGRTGADGRYAFDELAPGPYLLISSFDLAEVTAPVLQRAGAVPITLAPRQRAQQALRVHQRPDD